ncbi:5-methyltetrahydropteroyltriglutamate--homocysteine S-methyltransferase [Aureimonas populi]|uniref:5-methyltetrahydropteroyltriglutamate--homocysteine S-methyltransferase n=1 Tax=Aureimonas populi TaxID=1701758 RepID=A0ABW5CLS9_9HYPH|nr:5-methyltetrahydropteroyltriglutamate--homocysteine S-methyltransferase [Aureimonas populi]
MQRSRPPFRADMVGSLLRPARLKEARSRRAEGAISAEELKAVEDEEIARIVRKQEEIGLQSATDGEFRRAWWHFDFLEGLDGVEGYDAAQGIQFQGVQTKSRSVKVTGKLDFTTHPMLEHFRFLKETAKIVPKMTIPSPSLLHFRGGREAISTDVYPDMDGFFEDLAAAYAKAVKAFAEAGCRYLQLDDTVWAYLCSDEQRAQVRARGLDPDELQKVYSRMINAAIKDRPSDMAITMHICRGNFRSTWISEGGYGPVAETIFGELDIDGYFLEYDTERAGTFEPLRHVRKGGQQVVLGLVTSKTGTLEKPDDVKHRIDEAAKYVDLDQLGLSPQCGFASTEEGNVLAEDEQWAKLAMIRRIADDVWK